MFFLTVVGEWCEGRDAGWPGEVYGGEIIIIARVSMATSGHAACRYIKAASTIDLAHTATR